MPTILLIDDDVTLLSHLGEQLQEAGYRVLRASEIEAAELLVREEQPDLVLLDTGMSRGAGWVLLERLADRLPVMVISDQGLEEDVVRGLEAGAVDYLPKPFRSGELLARIRRHMRAVSARAASPAPADDEPGAISKPGEPAVAGEEIPAPPSPRLERPRSEGSRPTRRADPHTEEPIFIPTAEEQRLLRDDRPPTVDDLRPQDMAQLPLGQRLRVARQRKRITLVQAELERNKLRMHYIQAMEDEKFELLPRGPLAEELLRTYAEYLGLDVAQAVSEYRRQHYNPPVDPPLALGGSPVPRRLPPWVSLLTAITLALAIGCGGISLIDPGFVPSLANRARALAVPATATPTAVPTATSAPTVTPTATSAPTATSTPTATATPRPTPRPTATPTPVDASEATPTPRS